MTDSIQLHTRVRIRDGELDSFLAAAAKFVDATEGEPGADSCACYVDRGARTVTWFEIFRDLEGFLAHLENPAALALQPEMVPRVEEFERFEIYGDVPAQVLDSLVEQGFEPVSAPEHAGFSGKGR